MKLPSGSLSKISNVESTSSSLGNECVWGCTMLTSFLNLCSSMLGNYGTGACDLVDTPDEHPRTSSTAARTHIFIVYGTRMYQIGQTWRLRSLMMSSGQTTASRWGNNRTAQEGLPILALRNKEMKTCWG